MQENTSNVGPPIWTESLMTTHEWHTRYMSGMRSSSKAKPRREFDGPYKWRKGMGYGLSREEIENINSNIDYLKKLVKPIQP